jgi:hypothetical protein
MGNLYSSFRVGRYQITLKIPPGRERGVQFASRLGLHL